MSYFFADLKGERTPQPLVQKTQNTEQPKKAKESDHSNSGSFWIKRTFQGTRIPNCEGFNPILVKFVAPTSTNSNVKCSKAVHEKKCQASDTHDSQFPIGKGVTRTNPGLTVLRPRSSVAFFSSNVLESSTKPSYAIKKNIQKVDSANIPISKPIQHNQKKITLRNDDLSKEKPNNLSLVQNFSSARKSHNFSTDKASTKQKNEITSRVKKGTEVVNKGYTSRWTESLLTSKRVANWNDFIKRRYSNKMVYCKSNVKKIDAFKENASVLTEMKSVSQNLYNERRKKYTQSHLKRKSTEMLKAVTKKRNKLQNFVGVSGM